MHYDKRNKLLELLIVLVLFLLPSLIQAQEVRSKNYLDSIYNVYVSTGSKSFNPKNHTTIVSDEVSDHKCRFGLTAEVYVNFHNFTLQQQSVLKILDTRPVLESSVLSPSGHFRIHYDNTGANKPAYDPKLSVAENVRQIALAADSSWSFEINYLGYPRPPSDSGRGGDDAYDIYLINIATDEYGSTAFETEIGNGKWSSFMQMENDFSESSFATHGFNAARVTAAHEFHHAIQIGCYNYRDGEGFFHELTSTAMEEFVFSSVNDYYAYMREYFNSPDKTFSKHRGYDMAIWDIYLKEKFGYDIIKEQWEFYTQNPALVSINLSLAQHQSSFKNALNEFGIWTYYTNFKTIPNKYFKEAKNYPVLRPVVAADYATAGFPLMISSEPLSNNFINIAIPGTNRTDTVMVLVTDGDLTRAVNNPSDMLAFNFSLLEAPADGANKVSENIYSRVTSSKPSVFQEVDFFNDLLASPGLGSNDLDYAYPNPFNYKDLILGNMVYLPVAFNTFKTAEVKVFTVGMRLVYSSSTTIFPLNNKYVVSWNGMDTEGNRLPTGVYIYVTDSDGNLKKGKIVIQNE